MFSRNPSFPYNFPAEQNTDPNSPEAFKQHLQVIQDHVQQLRIHSQRALTGIKTAYHVGSNPSQTQEDINVVMHTLALLADHLRQSGIGALPLLETDATGQTEVPTEAELMRKATEGVQVYFEKVKRAQESSAVVANLLGSDLRPQRP